MQNILQLSPIKSDITDIKSVSLYVEMAGERETASRM
jgi:hypothetical protein